MIPVNLSQDRGVVGAFNSWFTYIKQHTIFMNAFSQSKVKQTIANETFAIFISLSIILLISSSWSFLNLLQIKATFISLLVLRISYICILLALIHHIWLYLIIFDWSGDAEKNLELKPNSYQSFSICHWNLNSSSVHNFLKLSLYKHTSLFINLMLYFYQRLISVHPFYGMIIIYKFQVIIYIGKIIL